MFQTIQANLKNKSLFKLFLMLSTFIFFISIFYCAYNRSQTDRFDDETAHVVIGNAMVHNKTLYKDIQSNHQPIVYFFSGAVSKITQPTNFHRLIKYERLAMAVYSILWICILIYFLGWRILPFSLIYEIVKYWNLGHQVLAEPLTVYPIIFLLGIILHKLASGDVVRKNELILCAISSFVVVFALLPLWPAIFVLNILIIFLIRNKRDLAVYYFFPLFLLISTLFLMIPPVAYFRETFAYNMKYFIPFAVITPSIASYTRIIFLPFLALFNISFNTSLPVALFLPLYTVITYYCWKRKKLFLWLIALFLLVITNNRTDYVNDGNFHLLPWLGVYFFIPFFFLPMISVERKSPWPMIYKICVVILVITLLHAYLFAPNPLNRKRDTVNDYYVNYSTSQSYGLAIAAVKSENDRLIAIPNDTVALWVSGAKSGTRVYEYYGWIFPIPEYNKEILNVFTHNPPEFVLDTGLTEDSALGRKIVNIIRDNYERITYIDKPSRLYILKKVIPKISLNQWEKFTYYKYLKPTGAM